MLKNLLPTPGTLQIIPTPKGQTVLAVPPVHTIHHLPHSHETLIFLTDLRQENVEAYLHAIGCHVYGKAAFLEGGLRGVDVVMQNPPPYANWLTSGETTLKTTITAHDWAGANWWKGYVCGLEIAIRVEKASWYKPARYGDRLLDWFEQTRMEKTR
jgi:hypothetical protein